MKYYVESKAARVARQTIFMTMQAGHIDEWLNKAFELAFFLHGNRETAKQIALNAMAKLETASTAQFKRNYYTPTGRAETAFATRSRVSLNDLQLLQRLVFVESECFEREKEDVDTACERRLLTYFIKHLVRISLKRNSFYVTLGISRILHNYATVEAMEIYNVVVQNPDRVHDDYYYRSRKGVLMKELKTRFGDLLDIVRVNRGEERFQTNSEGRELAEAAKQSLKFFTPWNSSCAMPDEFDPFDDVIKPFHFDKKDDPDAEHRIEVNRIHAALHPSCFSRLTDALNLPSPTEKMEIPKFMLTQHQAGIDDNDWRNPPPLEADELQTIKDILAAQVESRKAVSSNLLRVLVDDREQVRISLDRTDAVSFDLDDSAELIEVRSLATSGEITLATHLLCYEDLASGVNRYTVRLEGGQQVTFDLVPTLDSYGEIASLSCGIQYAETVWSRRLTLAAGRARFALGAFLEGQNTFLKPALAFGLILVALTVGWLVYQRGGENQARIGAGSENSNRDLGVPLPPANTESENSNVSVPANPAPRDLKLPGNRRPGLSDESQAPPAQDKKEKQTRVPAIPHELRASHDGLRDGPSTDENGILRLPIRERGERFPNESRDSRAPRIKGKSLGEIRLVYIEITGDAVSGSRLSEQIAGAIQAAGVFTVTTDKENADAALKIYVRHESDADTPDEATVAAIVRLVNAKGFVIYPGVKRVSGWKYVGTAAKVPFRIARDLIKAAEGVRTRKP